MAEVSAREAAMDSDIRQLPRNGMRELFVTRAGAGPETLPPTVEYMEQTRAAKVVAAEYFGPQTEAGAQATAADLLSDARMPLTWVQGGLPGKGLGGMHLHAVAGAEVRPLVLDGQVVGTVVNGPYASECMLGGIRPLDTTVAADLQARAAYERMEQALSLAEMGFCHVVRTWLFLDDILSWYSDFNRVRTSFFTEHGVFDRLVPASTGIGGSNPAGAAIVAGVYAVKSEHPQVTVQAIASPLQCPALEYGSSFSRAVEVNMPDLRRLLISGTASIGPDGNTQHVGEVRAQTALTCEVIGAILESRDMAWEEVTRATAYVRHGEDAGVLAQFCSAAGMPDLPVIVADNVICRDDLLFELEVDAVQTQAVEA